MYTGNNSPTYILISAKLDAVGQCWVAALANFCLQLHYKTGKSNIEADDLSQIPWQKAGSECKDLECLTVKGIIVGCTAENPLIEAYARKQ